jgi:hypothetical protein
VDPGAAVVLAAVINIVGVLAAGLIAARVASASQDRTVSATRQIAEDDRRAARVARVHEDLRQLAARLYADADRHVRQREAQWAGWANAFAGKTSPDEIPTVDSTEPIREAMLALDLVAHPFVGLAADALYGVSVRLDWFEYNSARHRHGNGVDDPRVLQFPAPYEGVLAEYRWRAHDFANAVRWELGLPDRPDPEALLPRPQAIPKPTPPSSPAY